MKKMIAMMIAMVFACSTIAYAEDGTIDTNNNTSNEKSVVCEDVVDDCCVCGDSNNDNTECNHKWVKDWFTTDWGYYEGLICEKCGEGEYRLLTDEEILERNYTNWLNGDEDLFIDIDTDKCNHDHMVYLNVIDDDMEYVEGWCVSCGYTCVVEHDSDKCDRVTDINNDTVAENNDTVDDVAIVKNKIMTTETDVVAETDVETDEEDVNVDDENIEEEI